MSLDRAAAVDIARVLTESLPYIQRFIGKTIVCTPSIFLRTVWTSTIISVEVGAIFIGSEPSSSCLCHHFYLPRSFSHPG